jgi:hypothetical protein
MEINNIITATEAIRSFSDIMNKVYYQHQSFDVKKGKVIVARIIPYNHSSKIEIKKSLKVANATELPYPDDYFDYVFH